MAIPNTLRERPPPGNTPYRAFLLRCWQEAGAGPEGEPAWRFTLVQLEGKQHKAGFASLDEVCAYVAGELANQQSSSDRRKRNI